MGDRSPSRRAVSWGTVVGTEAEIEERMARTRQIQRASIPKSFTSRGSTPRPKSAVVLLVVSALTAAWAAAMLSPLGPLIHAYMFVFLVFYAGPVTLVSLSLTVMAGLVATDRIVLLIRHRVLLQSTHRSLGIIAVFGLVLHVLTKISAGHVSAGTALLPLINGANVYVGLGTVAAVLMVSVLWTGLIRVRFAGVGKPWMWRALHSLAYAAWPIALVHGLQAGRAAATWVTVSYLLCVALVLAALLVRLSVTLGRKREEQGTGTGTGTMAPVGKAAKPRGPVRTSTAPAKRRTADEIRASRQNSAARDGGRSTVTGRDSRWDDQDTLSGRRNEPGIRTGRGADGQQTLTGRSAEREALGGRASERDILGGRDDDRDTRVGRRRRENLSDLRDDGSEPAIDSWARGGETDTTDSSRRRSDRFAVPEVPLATNADAGADRLSAAEAAELPWDSPRRWATSEPEDPWDRPRRGADDSLYRRPRSVDASTTDRDESLPGVDDDEPRSRWATEGEERRPRRAADDEEPRPRRVAADEPERRSWREPADEPAPTGTRAGRRRRAADEEPAGERGTERPRRRNRVRDDDAEESTAEWGRAARYEPNLADGTDSDDDDAERPALIGLAARRARKSGGTPGRASRRKESDEAAEEGAYWTSLKGKAR